MRCGRFALVALLVVVGLASSLIAPGAAYAQANNNGVIVDAQGVLRVQQYADPGGMLIRQQIAAARAALAPEITRSSNLRCVSITRLEKEIQARGGIVTDDMRYLAGLTRIKYVFYFPETKDIVIAGPAEGWVQTQSGRVRGMQSGHPIVQLQDLIVALRAYSPQGKSVGMIGCSIDPTPEGLAAMQQFLKVAYQRAQPSQAFANYVVQGLKTSLGLQNVRVDGISPRTHFAQVMVEADYRMKLIGIGIEQAPAGIGSYVGRANPSQVSRNAMERWYFVPNYECVRVTQDLSAMELVGDGVRLISENEMVNAAGQRAASGQVNRASEAFVSTFTKKYPELAKASPVYGELRNVIDMAIAAAYIQKANLYQKAGWNMDFFGEEAKFSVETYELPKTVETACTAIWKGNQLMTPVGGGVEIRASKALDSENLLEDENGLVAKKRQDLKLELAEGQWWWDAR